MLGKRKSATEASEKIAKVTEQEIEKESSSSSANASDNDAAGAGSNPSGERQSSRLRGRSTKNVSEKAKQLKEARLSADSGLANKVRCKRRRAGLDEELLTMYNPSALEDLLTTMMKHKDGWPFDRPITKSDAPDYSDIIQRPMDLGTVRTSLLHMKYSCNQEVCDDIRLVFENCYTYNADDAEEFQCANRLEKYFEKEARKLGLIVTDTSNGADSEEENQPLAKKSRRTTF